MRHLPEQLKGDGGMVAKANKRTHGVGAVALLLVLSIVPPASARTPQCLGYDATIVGTDGRDDLVGTMGRDVIVAGRGHDSIQAGHGADVICAGRGNDEVSAGTGRDLVKGGIGRDAIHGGEGLDALWGGPGDDGVNSGAGSDEDSYRYTSDVAYGDGGDDTINGNSGLNDLDGGPGDDLIFGYGAELDSCDCEDGFEEVLVGGPGDDELTGGTVAGILVTGERFSGGPGNDLIDAGDETLSTQGSSRRDLVDYSSAMGGVHIDLVAEEASGEGADVLRGIEHVRGTGFDDVIGGNDLANDISAGSGVDSVFGAGGNDRLALREGDVNGGYGDDNIVLTAGEVDGGSGRDSIRLLYPSVADLVSGTVQHEYGAIGVMSIESVQGSYGDDVITGDAGLNYINAESGNDRVEGGDGPDEIYGAAGDDILDGGPGVDALHGGDGSDRCDNGEVTLFCE